MPRTEKTALLSQVSDITPSVRELVFTPQNPNEFAFLAGQFVMLHIPQPEKPALRAYSIASSDKLKNEFRLIIKHFDGGLASAWVKAIKAGDQVNYTGPFGKFNFRHPPSEQVVFACTSTGLAPFYSMLLSQGLQFPNTKFHLFMGVWNEKEIFYEQKLQDLKSKLKNFNFQFVLDSPTSKDWKGLTGHVTAPIEKLDLKIPTQVYLCGNPNMIKSVKELLDKKGFPHENIFTESYG